MCLVFYLTYLPTSVWNNLGAHKFLCTSFNTCHGFITALIRHNLAISIALLGLRLRYRSRQSGFLLFAAISTLQGHGIPYGLYYSLSTLRIVCSIICGRTTGKSSIIHNLRATRKTRYWWRARPYQTGTFTP